MKKTILLLAISIMAIGCSKNNNVPDAENAQKPGLSSGPNPILMWYDLAMKFTYMDKDEIDEFLTENEWSYREYLHTFYKKLENDVWISFDYFHDNDSIAAEFEGEIRFDTDTTMSVEDARAAVMSIGSQIMMNGYKVNHSPWWHGYYEVYQKFGGTLPEDMSFEDDVMLIGLQDYLTSDCENLIVWDNTESQDLGYLEILFFCHEVNGSRYVKTIRFDINVPGKEDRWVD